MRGKCLVEMTEALNLGAEDTSRKQIPNDGNVWRQIALSLRGDLSKAPLKQGTFPASKGQLYRFRNRFGLKNVKISRDRDPPHSPNFYHRIVL